MHSLFKCKCGGTGWYTKEEGQDGRVLHVISCDKCGTVVTAYLYRECKWSWREKTHGKDSDYSDSRNGSEPRVHNKPTMVVCPWCGASVSEKRLDKHKRARCPLAPANIVAARPPPRPKPYRERVRKAKGRGIGWQRMHDIEVGANAPSIRKCVACGKPAVPGDDYCYSCQSS